ncbi:MAG: VOC family protein [Planctomycetota bacterium]
MPKLATRRAPKTAPRAAKAKAKAVKPIPDGYHTITPSLTVRNAAGAIEFFKKALGAELHGEVCACEDTGKIMHAEMKVGTSIFFLGDEAPQMGCAATQSSLFLYVKDADASIERAVKAGATLKYPASDMFWGDRVGGVADPFGNTWTFATHKKDLTGKQIEAAKQEFVAAMKAKAQGGCCGGSSDCGSKQ